MYYIKQVVVFCSSYLPLFLILLVSNLEFDRIKCGYTFLLGDGLKRNVLITLSIIIILVSLSSVWIFKNKVKSRPFPGNIKIEQTEYNFLNYFGTFIIPLTTFKADDIQSIILNTLMFVFLFIFYIQTESYYYNIFAMFMNRKIFRDQSNNYYISDYSQTDLEKLLKLNSTVKTNDITKKVSIIIKKYNNQNRYLR